ncbi:MAG: hypothetical protein ACRYG8_15515 [Janthinobacterium lividum]
MTDATTCDPVLCQRDSLTVRFTHEAIIARNAEPRTTRGSQPCRSTLVASTAPTLHAVCRTKGQVGSVLALLGPGFVLPD